MAGEAYRDSSEQLAQEPAAGVARRRLLEAGVHDEPVAARLLHAAGRLLELGETSAGEGGAGAVLRSDQLPVFRSLADWPADVATRTPQASDSPRGRFVLPPRTGKTVVAAHLVDRADLTATFVAPTRALVDQTERELRACVPGVEVGVWSIDGRRVAERGVNVITYPNSTFIDDIVVTAVPE